MQFARYGRLLTEAYDLDKPEAPAQELAYYLDWIRASREPVLEPMCGSGRFLVPLLERGIDADGVDASPDMLASCRRRCQERGVTLTLFEQRLHELELPRRYGVAFIPADSFGLIVDRAEASAALARLFHHLLPGGRLLFDVQRPLPAPGRQDRWTGRWWTRPDGAHIVLRTISHYDPEERVARSLGIYELFMSGRLVETELDEFVLRFYEPEEIRALLATSGFTGIEVSAAYQQRDPGEEDQLLSVRCIRAA